MVDFFTLYFSHFRRSKSTPENKFDCPPTPIWKSIWYLYWFFYTPLLCTIHVIFIQHDSFFFYYYKNIYKIHQQYYWVQCLHNTPFFHKHSKIRFLVNPSRSIWTSIFKTNIYLFKTCKIEIFIQWSPTLCLTKTLSSDFTSNWLHQIAHLYIEQALCPIKDTSIMLFILQETQSHNTKKSIFF